MTEDIRTVRPLDAADRKERILLVDDEPSAASAACLILQRGGYADVSVAHSAYDAFDLLGLVEDGRKRLRQAAGALPFDLIVLDIMMPGFDGIETCAAIRSTFAGRSIPIIMLSGVSEVQQLNQAFMAGATDFVSKPAKPIELISRINSMLRLARAQERSKLFEAEARNAPDTMAQISLDDSLIDSISLMPARFVAESIMRSCQRSEWPVAIGIIQVNDFDAYTSRWSRTRSDGLLNRISRIIRDTPVAAGAILAHFDDAHFLIALPNTANTEQVDHFCDAVRTAVKCAALPHGNSLKSEVVEVSVATGWNKGPEIAQLPGNLLRVLRDDLDEGIHHALV